MTAPCTPVRCLENPTEEPGIAAVHGVPKTRLSLLFLTFLLIDENNPLVHLGTGIVMLCLVMLLNGHGLEAT